MAEKIDRRSFLEMLGIGAAAAAASTVPILDVMAVEPQFGHGMFPPNSFVRCVTFNREPSIEDLDWIEMESGYKWFEIAGRRALPIYGGSEEDTVWVAYQIIPSDGGPIGYSHGTR